MLYFGVFVMAFLGTYTIRYIAIKKKLLDHPNARSSHTTATPKGGGLAIIVSFFIALSFLYLRHTIETPLFLALMSVLPVVMVSFVDDIYPLSAKRRFGVQLFSALSALYFLGGISTIDFGLFSLHGVWLNIIALVGIIWMTNLYNFLDGIDGYAASEALFVALGAFILFGNEMALLLGLASAGFLMFNWHKASIFMGDVGSAPLGFIFAIFILYDANTPHFIAWLVLLSLFWFDATYTLLRRYKHHEKLSQAHKKHAYQRFNQVGFSHDKVVLMGMGINLVLLLLLWTVPQTLYIYLLLATVILLYGVTKFIDRLKAF